MKKIVLIIILFHQIFPSCKTDDLKEPKLKLTKTGIKAIPLDKETGHHHSSFFIQNINRNKKAIFFNGTNKKIYIYDWEKSKLLKTINVPQNDSSAIVSNDSDGAFFGPNENLYYYCYNNYTIYKIENDKFQPVFTFNHAETKELISYYDFPQIGSLTPVIISGDSSILITNNISIRRTNNFEKLHSLFRINIKSGYELERLVTAPKIYNKGNWGRTLGYQAYHCFNYDSTKVISSFGKSDSLIITDIHTNNKTYKDGSSKFFNISSQKPLSEISDVEEKDFYKGFNYDFTTPTYFGIFYDPGLEKYFRLTQYAFPDKETVIKNNGELRIGISYSIIVFDKNLNKIDEVSIPKTTDLNLNYIIFTDKLLYIALLPSRQQFEDSLIFNTYEFN